MTSELASKILVNVGKIAFTIVLLFLVFAWTFFLICILPMILFVIYHGRGKKNNINGFKFAVAMAPVGIVGTLIWKLWNVTKEATHEIST